MSALAYAADPRPAAPILKWAGGKATLVPALLGHVPASYRRYYEPFAGGAALFFALAPTQAVLGDRNVDLIATYRAVAVDTDRVMACLRRHRAQHGADHYYRTRTRWNERRPHESLAARAAMFIYLNKAGYNGLWRVNARGGFNVPFGRNPNARLFDPEALRTAAQALGHAELRAGDYRDVLADAGDGDFVYLDPPYAPLSRTAKFTAYTAQGFGPDEQRALAALAHELVGRGCTVLASNHDTPAVRALYAGFAQQTVARARSINSNAARRGPVPELVLAARPAGLS